jgi:hypothetical protein
MTLHTFLLLTLLLYGHWMREPLGATAQGHPVRHPRIYIHSER